MPNWEAVGMPEDNRSPWLKQYTDDQYRGSEDYAGQMRSEIADTDTYARQAREAVGDLSQNVLQQGIGQANLGMAQQAVASGQSPLGGRAAIMQGGQNAAMAANQAGQFALQGDIASAQMAQQAQQTRMQAIAQEQQRMDANMWMAKHQAGSTGPFAPPAQQEEPGVFGQILGGIGAMFSSDERSKVPMQGDIIREDPYSPTGSELGDQLYRHSQGDSLGSRALRGQVSQGVRDAGFRLPPEREAELNALKGDLRNYSDGRIGAYDPNPQIRMTDIDPVAMQRMQRYREQQDRLAQSRQNTEQLMALRDKVGAFKRAGEGGPNGRPGYLIGDPEGTRAMHDFANRGGRPAGPGAPQSGPQGDAFAGSGTGMDRMTSYEREAMERQRQRDNMRTVGGVFGGLGQIGDAIFSDERMKRSYASSDEHAKEAAFRAGFESGRSYLYDRDGRMVSDGSDAQVDRTRGVDMLFDRDRNIVASDPVRTPNVRSLEDSFSKADAFQPPRRSDPVDVIMEKLQAEDRAMQRLMSGQIRDLPGGGMSPGMVDAYNQVQRGGNAYKQFVEGTPLTEYSYKAESGYPTDSRVGTGARAVAQAGPIGRSMTKETPGGMVIDQDRGVGAALGGAARNAREIEALRAEIARLKGESGPTEGAYRREQLDRNLEGSPVGRDAPSPYSQEELYREAFRRAGQSGVSFGDMGTRRDIRERTGDLPPEPRARDPRNDGYNSRRWSPGGRDMTVRDRLQRYLDWE